MPPSATAGRGAKASLTRDKVIERIRRWAELFGEPPGTADWNPSVARWRAQEWRVARYELGDPETGERWPSTTAAKRRFDGSFDAAVRAAGLEPRPAGPRRPAGTRGLVAGAAGRASSGAGVATVALRDELLAAWAQTRAAEARAATAERALARGDARIARAEASAAEARRRSRRLADRARRAVAARDRLAAAAVAARSGGADAARRAHVEADARVAAAEDHAQAAVRDGQRARGLASSSVREAARLAEALSGALRRAEEAEHVVRELTRSGSVDLAAVRAEAGPAGPAVLAEALHALRHARTTNDPVRLAAALSQVGRAASGWRSRL